VVEGVVSRPSSAGYKKDAEVPVGQLVSRSGEKRVKNESAGRTDFTYLTNYLDWPWSCLALPHLAFFHLHVMRGTSITKAEGTAEYDHPEPLGMPARRNELLFHSPDALLLCKPNWSDFIISSIVQFDRSDRPATPCTVTANLPPRLGTYPRTSVRTTISTFLLQPPNQYKPKQRAAQVLSKRLRRAENAGIRIMFVC